MVNDWRAFYANSENVTMRDDEPGDYLVARNNHIIAMSEKYLSTPTELGARDPGRADTLAWELSAPHVGSLFKSTK
jgi:hypothetical protein